MDSAANWISTLELGQRDRPSVLVLPSAWQDESSQLTFQFSFSSVQVLKDIHEQETEKMITVIIGMKMSLENM